MSTASIETDIRSLLALGQARRPWEFVRAVAAAGPDVASIPPIRFLLAANLGSLGFGELAIEELDAVDASGTPGLKTTDLRSSLAARPVTALPAAMLAATLQHNLALLGIHLDGPDSPAVWSTETGTTAWREDGTVTGCDAAAHADSVLEHSGLAVDRVPADHLPPLLIAGLSTPHLLHGALRASRALANGYTPRIFVVEPDIGRAGRALSMLRLDDGLGGEPVWDRITLLTGPDAIDDLQEQLRESIDCSLPRAMMIDALAPKPLTEGVQRVLTTLHELQRAAIDTEAARIERECQALDEAARRVNQGRGLRVLIPVSRHSNFVRHSASDLADALKELGHIPTILTEPEPHRVLSRLGYLRAWASTEPDLVLSINHPRWRTASALPERAPSICWVQDAMPHHFEDAAAQQGEHDFVVGYRFHELTDRFGYRADRVIDAVLPVSTAKFHGGPVDPALAERFRCDVAFATRQSETPEAMATRLRADMPEGSAASGAVDHAFGTLRELISSDRATFTLREFQEVARSALEAVDAQPDDPRALDEVIRLIVMPLADRLVRHRVVEWAAEICTEQNWDLALYGSGWDRHPTLARFARGELDHGDELRAAYRCAGVHLGASAHSLVHQRTIECLLSGGKMLCYRRLADLADARFRLLGRLAGRTPDRIDESGDPEYLASKHADVRAHFERYERFGRTEGRRFGDAIRLKHEFLERFRESPLAGDTSFDAVACSILDGFSVASRDEFASMLERALTPSDGSDSELASLRDEASKCWSTTDGLRRVLQDVAAAIGADS